jgi:hypothetical protein
MDPRVEQTQRLFWEIEHLRPQGACRLVTRKLIAMAHLHEERGRELLTHRDPDGWTDWYAAITAWAKAGSMDEARRLVREGCRLAGLFADGQDNVLRQLEELDAWIDSRVAKVVPALMDFARSLPTFPVEAA